MYANYIAFATKARKGFMMKDILREIGMIARALDSISNIEFKEHDLTKGNICTLSEYAKTRESFRRSWLR